LLARFETLQNNPLPCMTEAVPAYSTLTIFYDLLKVKNHITKDNFTAYEWMKIQTEKWLHQNISHNENSKTVVSIPVCYDEEFAPDLPFIAETKKINIEELIALHIAKTYRVYMLGFLPGFAYMGQLDEKISCPRKNKPVLTNAGSVGIASRQTGIYPLSSPGGWQIIGRTPLKMFDPQNENPALLKAGDEVRFISISKDEFKNYTGRNS